MWGKIIRFCQLLLVMESVCCIILSFPVIACSQEMTGKLDRNEGILVAGEIQEQIPIHKNQSASGTTGQGDLTLDSISAYEITTIGVAVVICAGGLILSNHRKWV